MSDDRNVRILVFGLVFVVIGLLTFLVKFYKDTPTMPGPNQILVTNSTGGSALCESVISNGCEFLVCWQGNAAVSVAPLAPCPRSQVKP